MPRPMRFRFPQGDGRCRRWDSAAAVGGNVIGVNNIASKMHKEVVDERLLISSSSTNEKVIRQ